ncbi:hypothetical protein HNR44_001735 [Geomicrobium halophilum]|uniref:Uncharacterized protein n=1 Tax=Geomicrobium halophilum TaxID=549000 RepID=A0A841PLM4_9BACL|nr:hypothetical protein [Geomicrobium halophilum]MBB6449757.1 hypothetical protein [Geomicrobium halophilum]
METEKIHVAEHLTDYEYRFFLNAYAHHSRHMDLNGRGEYMLSKIEKVEPCIRNESLNVYFSNGTSWRYFADGGCLPNR